MVSGTAVISKLSLKSSCHAFIHGREHRNKLNCGLHLNAFANRCVPPHLPKIYPSGGLECAHNDYILLSTAYDPISNIMAHWWIYSVLNHGTDEESTLLTSSHRDYRTVPAFPRARKTEKKEHSLEEKAT